MFVVSIVLSLASLFVVGAGVSLLTGRSMLFSGARSSRSVPGRSGTYAVGTLIGVGVAG